jgi:uncharacterized protein
MAHTRRQVPVVSYLRLSEQPSLIASRCRSCGQLYLLRRTGCGQCGQRSFETGVELPRAGKVVTASLVHRAPPGVQTPFVSGVVELDGGFRVRSTVIGPLDADPLRMVGQTVTLETSVVGIDRDGTEAVGFTFNTERR